MKVSVAEAEEQLSDLVRRAGQIHDLVVAAPIPALARIAAARPMVANFMDLPFPDGVPASWRRLIARAGSGRDSHRRTGPERRRARYGPVPAVNSRTRQRGDKLRRQGQPGDSDGHIPAEHTIGLRGGRQRAI